MQNISNQSLIKTCSFINGQWLSSSSVFEVINPASEKVMAQVFEVTSTQVEQAVIAAYNALDVWQGISASSRSEKLDSWQRLLRENLTDLARLLTLEQGKPVAEAKAEIRHAANYVKLYSQLAEQLIKTTSVDTEKSQKGQVFRRPMGVVSAITPWNFPCSMVLRKAAAAMAAGCCVVLKPSELTPLTALALAQLSVEAEIPAGVFNLVVGSNAQAIGSILTQHPKVAKLSFTGSTKVGKKLLAQCAAGVKRSAMELGGNAPFIVFDDADLQLAVDGAMASKFRNAGQTCVTANRFLIQRTIVEKFVSRLIKAVQALKMGDGLESDHDLGPLINVAAVNKVQNLVDDSLLNGGTLLLGGNRHTGQPSNKKTGFFFEPTILQNITANMAIFNNEIFGPVVSITPFENESHAISLANQSDLGLCAYLYTRNTARIASIAEKLEVGMLGINEARLSNPAAPFGGFKQSGMGREGGCFGIKEYLDYQYVCRAVD